MSKVVVVALLALVSVVCADPHLLKTHFQLFVNQYAKNYSSDAEAAFRFKVFKDNLATVALLNAGLEQPNFGVTKFSDLTAQEFKATYLRRTPHLAKLADTDKVYPRAPKSNFKRFDWRQKGAITPVKNQGTECGSCWAFSSTEVVESMWFLAGHPLTTLAPQQLVSCDQQNEGCNGGDTLPALQTIIEQGGLMAESSYPYTSAQTGENGKCNFDASKVVARVKDYMYGIQPCNDSCNHQDESALVDAVTTYGPASICISADVWQHYTGGILRATCPASADASNHCAQLVGYDKTGSTPYWIVKNQWGEDWGEDGYIYLPIGKNVCGLADEVLYAVI